MLPGDDQLLSDIITVAKDLPTYGYRRVWTILKFQGIDGSPRMVTFAKQLGLKPVRTPLESPQSNGMAESYVKTLKRDYARLANRPDSQTVMRELKLWFEHYNEKHPHSALEYLLPRRFRGKQMSIN